MILESDCISVFGTYELEHRTASSLSSIPVSIITAVELPPLSHQLLPFITIFTFIFTFFT